MNHHTVEKFNCPVCSLPKPPRQGTLFDLVHEPFSQWIQKRYPDLKSDQSICLSCLNLLRSDYIKTLIISEGDEFSSLKETIQKGLEEFNTYSKNINSEFEKKLTFGEKMADKVASFGGSWVFIICFFSLILIWCLSNSQAISSKPLDPFPFILLNLILSCLASIQAPIIMMSQNRLESRDRLRSEYDYKINLKAELEIRHLNMKIDELLSNQWQRLLDIQRIQLQIMEEIEKKAMNSSDKTQESS